MATQSQSFAARFGIRKVVKTVLPPKAFSLVRYSWWAVTKHVPRQITAEHFYPEAEGSAKLVNRIERIDLGHSTWLCHLMTFHQSDKGNQHNYSRVYSALWGDVRFGIKRVFELGLGTNNTSFPGHMGANGIPGASLHGWRRYFEYADIFGADIDRGVLFKEERINASFYCDQTSKESIAAMWAEPDLAEPFDIIIEDGLHEFDANVLFLEESIGKLREGGYYVVEDVKDSALRKWEFWLLENATRWPGFEFAIAHLPYRFAEFADNNLIVVRRTLGLGSQWPDALQQK
jgi:SAM-dependent methyltransferase